MRSRANFGVLGAVQSITAATAGRIYSVDDMQIARRSGNWPSLIVPTLLAQVYNTSNSTASTGSFTVPVGYNKIIVYACAGGGSSGFQGYQDNGHGAGGGGAANITGFEITVTDGDVINYSVGNGGVAPTSTATGGAGANTTLIRSGTTLLALGGGAGGAPNGGNGGAGGLVVTGTGVAGGAGGKGGERSGSAAGDGAGVTNGCGGGGGGGGHLGNRPGGAGGSSTINVGTITHGSITLAFNGGAGGSAGTPGIPGTPGSNIELARSGFGEAQDSNTGAGGGAGRGIQPVVNGTADSFFYGAGGGGNRSYITNATPNNNGRGAGGFLIVVAVAV